MVSKVTDVLENNYLNPFSINLDCEELFNLSSGLQYQDDPEALLNIWDILSTSKKVKSASTSSEVVKANRNILGKLLSLSERFEEAIDCSRALQYPLYPVPLSLSFPDGTKRQTQKSKLLEVLSIKNQRTTSEKRASTLIIDMIAQYRTIANNVPDKFEDLIFRFLISIPKGFSRVDIVADCYWDVSIKGAEREKRGNCWKILFSSVKSNI